MPLVALSCVLRGCGLQICSGLLPQPPLPSHLGVLALQDRRPGALLTHPELWDGASGWYPAVLMHTWSQGSSKGNPFPQHLLRELLLSPWVPSEGAERDKTHQWPQSPSPSLKDRTTVGTKFRAVLSFVPKSKPRVQWSNCVLSAWGLARWAALHP